MPIYFYHGQSFDDSDYALAMLLTEHGYDWSYLVTLNRMQMECLWQSIRREQQAIVRRLEFYRREYRAGRLNEGIRYHHARS